MIRIFRNTWSVLDKKERIHFRWLIFLDLVISILDILSLALLVGIIQSFIQPHTPHSLLPSWFSRNDTAIPVTGFLLLFCLKNLAAYRITRAHFHFVGKVAVRISRNRLIHYQASDFNEFIATDSSAHIRQIAFQPFEYCQYMLTGISQIITETCLIIIAIVAIILFNPPLFLLLLCILLPPVILIFYLLKSRMEHAKMQIRESNEKSFQYLLDALKGFVEGNIYNRNPFFLDRFVRQREQFSHHLFASMSIQTAPSRIIEVFAITGLFTLVILARSTGHEDSATLLTIGAFMAAAYKIIPGIVKIVNAAGQMKANAASLDELRNTLGPTSTSANQKPVTISSLELNDIDFSYPGRKILTELNLSLRPGDFIAITGPSGQGKTTILNLILGFLNPDKGHICLNHAPASRQVLCQHWQAIAYVRQQSFLIHDTLIRNITLEETVKDRGRLQNALHISGLDKIINDLPDGIEHLVTENGKNISGGQQQRIAIARAIYKDADLLLLDEPFNELDEQSVSCLLLHFKKMAANGKIIVMITHDKKSLIYCNKIMSLDDQ